MASKPNLATVISEVLRDAGKPMTADAIFSVLESKSLYEFNSKNPSGIVRSCLSRHSAENTSPNASKRKVFTQKSDGTYGLLPE